MFEFEEGSIFDPDLFKPKPKKKPIEQTQQEFQQPPAQKVDWKPIVKNAERIRHNAFGIFKEFQRTQSPSYKLNKTNMKIKELDARERLMERQVELREKQFKFKQQAAEQRQSEIDEIKRKLGFRQRIGLPKAKYE
jgi:hypothetical protein